MANRNILIATAVLVAGAGAILLLDRNGSGPKDARIGKPVMEATALPDVNAIRIKKGDTTLELNLGEGQMWRIGGASSDAGFPADASRIVRMLDDLSRTTLQMVVGTSKDQMAEFGLGSPVEVTVSGGGKELQVIQIGDSRKGGGQYIALGGESKTYLTSQNLRIDSDVASWEMKTLLNIAKEDVAQVVFTPAAGDKKPVTLSRATKEESLKPADMAEGEAVTSQATAAENILANVTFSKRVDPGNEEFKVAMSAVARTDVTTFDGRRFLIETGSAGKDNAKFFVRIRGEKGDKTDAKGESHVKMLNELMSKYAFEVPAFVANRFQKSRSDYVEVKSAPKG